MREKKGNAPDAPQFLLLGLPLSSHRTDRPESRRPASEPRSHMSVTSTNAPKSPPRLGGGVHWFSVAGSDSTVGRNRRPPPMSDNTLASPPPPGPASGGRTGALDQGGRSVDIGRCLFRGGDARRKLHDTERQWEDAPLPWTARKHHDQSTARKTPALFSARRLMNASASPLMEIPIVLMFR